MYVVGPFTLRAYRLWYVAGNSRVAVELWLWGPLCEKRDVIQKTEVHNVPQRRRQRRAVPRPEAT